MKQVQTALYLLADGTHAKPGDCERDDDGVLRHIYGMPVALKEDGEPVTVGEAAVDNKNVEAAQAGEDAMAEAKATDVLEAAAEAPAEQPVTEVDPATGQRANPIAPAEPAEAPKAKPKALTPEEEKRGYKTRDAKAK